MTEQKRELTLAEKYSAEILAERAEKFNVFATGNFVFSVDEYDFIFKKGSETYTARTYSVGDMADIKDPAHTAKVIDDLNRMFYDDWQYNEETCGGEYNDLLIVGSPALASAYPHLIADATKVPGFSEMISNGSHPKDYLADFTDYPAALARVSYIEGLVKGYSLGNPSDHNWADDILFQLELIHNNIDHATNSSLKWYVAELSKYIGFINKHCGWDLNEEVVIK